MATQLAVRITAGVYSIEYRLIVSNTGLLNFVDFKLNLSQIAEAAEQATAYV